MTFTLGSVEAMVSFPPWTVALMLGMALRLAVRLVSVVSVGWPVRFTGTSVLLDKPVCEFVVVTTKLPLTGWKGRPAARLLSAAVWLRT